MPPESFEEICEEIGADPAKGYSLQDLAALYLDRSLPEEVQLDLDSDFGKLFTAPAAKRGGVLIL